jgi:hypothetical protein
MSGSPKTICQDCAFHTHTQDSSECIHPDESGVDCAKVTFCSSFQPAQEIDSPCVCFCEDDGE